MLGELNREQINNILQSQSVCRIGCVDNNRAYVVPISYFFDGEYIYAQSREGKKINLLRNNPNVCIEIDVINGMNNWQSVIAYGKYEELKGDASNAARQKLFDNVLTLMTNSKIHKFQHEDQNDLDDSNRIKLIMFCIKIIESTGRYEKQTDTNK